MHIFWRHLLLGLIVWWSGNQAFDIAAELKQVTETLHWSSGLLFHPTTFLRFCFFYGCSFFLLKHMLRIHYRQIRRGNALFTQQFSLHLLYMCYLLLLLAILWIKFPRLTTLMLLGQLFYLLLSQWRKARQRKVIRQKQLST